ncbi:MAG: aconitate hydratase AcnA [Candidatus Binatia bacterium]|nr:aconitate hydratase AcnA [Candidatus Binatia bacterium]MDG2010228.1 aconitate hydratase AcnA [Candidatus Binatia bacterium]
MQDNPLANTIDNFTLGNGETGKFYSLLKLEAAGFGDIARLPVSIRIVLESVLRNCDAQRIREEDVRALAQWQPQTNRTAEIPFVVSRIVLQDFTGVPLLVDLAAMRSAVDKIGRDPKLIEPLVPVDLVVDHSVQVDVAGVATALEKNMEIEFQRNRERYQFLKWGMQAFDTFKVVPPGIGIVHQVNLEYLARGVLNRDDVYYPDTLVGTDSHTTMINGLGIVGWGVGGIEAEAGMLGQPVYFLTPDVVGVNLTGSLPAGVTATDLVLRVTELLRAAKVVGKFVEFHGEGATALPLTDRATVANMAPEYGATMGFFGTDDQTLEYLAQTGRSPDDIQTVGNYYRAQGMFGIPEAGTIDYSKVIDLDLGSIRPGVAGPKRPQDRINLSELGSAYRGLMEEDVDAGGFGRESSAIGHQVELELPAGKTTLGNGDVVIAAITSCTNTSNPSVMLAAGLLAQKAVQRGLQVRPTVKTSLGPGSRVVTEYLEKTGLQKSLDTLGFETVGYGCTTCIGNSGPLAPAIESAIVDNELVAASVLSGNRNFEARVHQQVRANFLMSPPLVVAFALAGTIDIDMTTDPLGQDTDGKDVFLRDLWPPASEIQAQMHAATDPETFRRLYADFAAGNPLWNEIPSSVGNVYEWEGDSTYIQDPPFFENFSLTPGTLADVKGARPLALFGDSVTTDHISPAGAIKEDSPAGRYLQEHGVAKKDFNSFGSRRGNDQVMTRGTFGNVRIKNRMVPGVEGGVTMLQPDGVQMDIYDAAMRYADAGVPLVILAGQEYGTGSSRDWAAKGTRLQGVRAVVAASFERIHRSNLVGMGVLPCQFKDGDTIDSLGLDGTETFDLIGVEAEDFAPQQDLSLTIHRADGTSQNLAVTVRIDTPIEIEYYRHGGILPYVLRQLLEG